MIDIQVRIRKTIRVEPEIAAEFIFLSADWKTYLNVFVYFLNRVIWLSSNIILTRIRKITVSNSIPTEYRKFSMLFNCFVSTAERRVKRKDD
jgi:hypothetical protein